MVSVGCEEVLYVWQTFGDLMSRLLSGLGGGSVFEFVSVTDSQGKAITSETTLRWLV